MPNKDVFLTEDGYKKIENELETLKTVTRKEIAQRIKIAIGYGDLSENAEYDEAKNEQAQIEEKIVKLEAILRSAKLIEEDEITTDYVSVGATVKLKDLEFDETMEYTIVGSAEADPFNGKISNESPLGTVILGKKRNQVVEVQAPNGILKYKILKIAK